ncbi:MAG: DUF1206 domain-containing protein [Phormidesmis sp.]
MSSPDSSQQVHERWIEHYARFGYAAKGIIYGSTGILATQAAFDLGENDAVGSTGALSAIADQPFGRVALVVIAFSLMGYVVWRLIQAFLDPEHSSSNSFSDVVRRIGYACSGVVYASITVSAVKIFMKSSDNGGRNPADWALIIMRQPLGRFLLGAIGLTFFGIGCYYFYRTIKAEFRKRFKLHTMSSAAKTWATIMGRVGIAARGIVYVVIGFYTMKAAWEFDADVIKTTEDALATFNDNPTDEWILATLGIGFIAYGVHMFFQARYRSIDPL